MIRRATDGIVFARRSGRRAIRGQTMVEFAMIISIALTLLFGIIQAGLALYAYSFVSYAARSGVRYAMVRGSKSPSAATNASVQTYVQGLAVALDTTQLTATTTWPDGNNNPGSRVKVVVTYAFAPFTKLVWSATLNMSSTAQGLVSN